MKNIEKYEKELRKYGVYFALTKEGKLVGCVNNTCLKCAFYNSCSIKRMKWLLEEYEEPILTEEGKEFLKQLIVPFEPNKFKSVSINKDLQFFRLNYETGWVCYPKKVLGEKWDWFKNLNPEKLYTIDELGLCERLKGE